MHIVDYFVIAGYFALVMYLGYYSMKKVSNFDDYAVAGRSMPLPIFFAAIAATLCGGGATIGRISFMHTTGIIVFFALTGVVINQIFSGLFISERVHNAGKNVYSLGDLFGIYYGRSGRLLSSVFGFLFCVGAFGVQILAMGAITRLDCALGTAGLMRHALSLALHHARQREAFGKRLVEQPLMKNVLADLAIESEAATALALRLARAVDRCEAGEDASGHEAAMRRLLTPIAKFWICKRGSHFAQEAMECLGGNGYVEEQGEGVMARIYREMPLNSIWEGAGNIMALDLLRTLRDPAAGAALEHELEPARQAHPAFDRRRDLVLRAVGGITEEVEARRLARDLALLLQATLLRQHSSDAVFAAFCASRFDTADVFGLLPAGVGLDAILERA